MQEESPIRLFLPNHYALLHTVERLERLCPENAALLSLVKRNFAWRQKVEATG